MRRAVRIAGALLLGTAAASAVLDRDRGLPRPAPEELVELERRWNSMSELERDRFRSRFETLEGLDPESQKRVAVGIRRLDEMARLVFNSLDTRTRGRLLGLDAAKRLELLREMAVAEARDMGQRVLANLPPADRERLENATQAERLEFLIQFRRDQDARLEQTMDAMAEEVGMGASELASLRELRPDERRVRFLELVRRRVARIVEQRGLPDSIRPEYWRRALALGPREFYLVVQRLQRNESTRLPLGRRGRPGRSPWVAVRRALVADLDPETRIELADLPPGVRDGRVRGVRRAAALDVLLREDLMDEAELEELDRHGDAAFFEELRARIRVELGR